MADISNLSNFLEDVADAIRVKKETTEKIPAANFDTEILGITTGIDTSDATATADDIIYPKTAYVNNEKITGTIESTIGNVPGNITLDQHSGTSIPAYFAVNNNYILHYDFTNHLIILSDLNGLKLDELSYVMSNGYFVNIVISNVEDDICYGIVNSNSNTAMLLKIQDNKIVASKEQQINDYARAIRITAGRNHNRLFADEYRANSSGEKGLTFFMIDTDLNIISQKSGGIGYTTDFNGYGYFTNGDEYYVMEHPYATGKTITRTEVYKLNIVGNSIVSYTHINGDIDVTYFNDNLSLGISNNKLYSISVSGNRMTYSELMNISYEGTPLMIAENYLYVFSGETVYLYQVSTSGIELKFTFNTSHNIDDSYVRWNPNNYVGFFAGANMDFTNLDNTEILTYMKAKGVKLYNPYDADVTSEDIIQDKIAYGKNGKVIGTMSNNGELNYEVSTSEQTIPAGYTSGGTIEAARQTNEDYDGCLELAQQILYGGIITNYPLDNAAHYWIFEYNGNIYCAKHTKDIPSIGYENGVQENLVWYTMSFKILTLYKFINGAYTTSYEPSDTDIVMRSSGDARVFDDGVNIKSLYSDIDLLYDGYWTQQLGTNYYFKANPVN